LLELTDAPARLIKDEISKERFAHLNARRESIHEAIDRLADDIEMYGQESV
jgi:hypothetical protein